MAAAGYSFTCFRTTQHQAINCKVGMQKYLCHSVPLWRTRRLRSVRGTSLRIAIPNLCDRVLSLWYTHNDNVYLILRDYLT